VAPGSNPTPKKIDALKGVNVKKIICGPIHNFAIDDKGALYSWGSGHYAQHGQGIPDMISTPTPVRALQDNPVELVAAGLYHSVIVTKSQEVLFFGGYKTKPPGSNMHRMNFFLKPTPLKDAALTDPNEQWTHLTAGITHNVLTSSKGRSFAWGLNTSSAVGTDRPSSIDRAVSLDELSGVIFDVLASGPYHNMGIDSSGSVWGWGQGSDFQLAGERRNVTVPTKLSIGLPEDLSVIQIAAGWAHTLILAAPKQSL
jgi:regulator of chromosome condensation